MTTAITQPTVAEPRVATTVRDAAIAQWRTLGMTRMFANPGSTEIGLLARLPADITLTLALHEGSVVGMATGYALARREPTLVVLHTTAGLGNAVGALATARVNRAPLVVIVGQQDRRHLVSEPFLTGRLEGLAGDYPVWHEQPIRARDVPGAIARAWTEAREHHGPAIVVVPMDDWEAPAGDVAAPAPDVLWSACAPDPGAVAALAEMLRAARHPCLVVGAGADDAVAWAELDALADGLDCQVWQESFGARAGFRQDHPRFAGHLPARRRDLRRVLSGHDVVLVVGAPVFRQYQYDSGPLVPPSTRIALVTAYGDEARAAPVELAVHADPATVLTGLRTALGIAPAGSAAPATKDAARVIPAAPRQTPSPPLRACDVYEALGRRLAPETTLVEETPSTRLLLSELVPARMPLGFLSAAMGGLGFALPAAVGLRLADPSRPVVAVVGDGSAMYGIHALWSAAHYRIGVLIVIMSNGGYAIMDRLAREAGDPRPPWPPFPEVQTATVAAGLGCPSERIEDLEGLERRLDAVVPGLAEREQPLLLDVVVTADGSPTPRPRNHG